MPPTRSPWVSQKGTSLDQSRSMGYDALITAVAKLYSLRQTWREKCLVGSTTPKQEGWASLQGVYRSEGTSVEFDSDGLVPEMLAGSVR